MIGKIYKIINITNNKGYIGQTEQDVLKRWYRHIYESFNKNNKSYNTPLHRAIRKYGINNFIIEEISITESKKLLDALEQCYIEEHQTDIRFNGYNVARGGTGGDLISYHPNHKNICKKFSKRSKQCWTNPEYREKMLNYFHSDAHKPTIQKLQDGNKKYWADENNKQEYANKYLKGSKNPMYKKNIYSVWLQKYGKEIADQKYLVWKQKCKQNANKIYHGTKQSQIKLSITKTTPITDKQWFQIVTLFLAHNPIRTISSVSKLSPKIIRKRLQSLDLIK